MTVINISTESVQWSTSFLIHFRTSHFSAVQTTRNQHFNTFSTCFHSVGNSHLDSAAICDFTFNLTSDVISNDNSVKFWFLNFEDINLNILIGDLLQLFFQLVNFLTTFTNDNTRTSCANGNSNQFQSTFDNDS